MASDFIQMDLLAWEPAPTNPWDMEVRRRNDICPDWQACMHKDICFVPENEENSICFIDEPDKVPGRGPFSRCELKVLSSGFMLVRYDRAAKKIELSEADICNGWTALEPFPTYAAAERKLKELIEKGYIQTELNGKIVMSGWNLPGRLSAAGFEFYRVYGFHHSYESNYCIKIGSKNWSNLAKYKDRAELRRAWNNLMTEDPKALEG